MSPQDKVKSLGSMSLGSDSRARDPPSPSSTSSSLDTVYPSSSLDSSSSGRPFFSSANYPQVTTLSVHPFPPFIIHRFKLSLLVTNSFRAVVRPFRVTCPFVRPTQYSHFPLCFQVSSFSFSALAISKDRSQALASVRPSIPRPPLNPRTPLSSPIFGF